MAKTNASDPIFSLEDMVDLMQVGGPACYYDTQHLLQKMARHLLEQGKYEKEEIYRVFNKYAFTLPPTIQCVKCNVNDSKPIYFCDYCKGPTHKDPQCAYEIGRFCSPYCEIRICATNYCKRTPYEGRKHCIDCILQGKADTDDI
jgi:hypothetical protein